VSSALPSRLEALREVVELSAGRLPPELLDGAHDLSERAGARLRLSGEHTVVALAGATGSGKSSLFNAITRAELAAVGVRRPTTSATQACVIGPDGATALLDWLGVEARHQGEVPALAGLVLLDLPDHDSTEHSHRAEVDRVLRLVDAFVWVLDPQKYADAVVHERYLRPLASHREVMLVVLNQADLLPSYAVAECLTDLRRLLVEDGLAGVPVLATSATAPGGAEPLRGFLAATVADHRARTARIAADLSELAGRMTPLVPARRSEPDLRAEEVRLRSALGRAAGVPGVVDAVGRAHERRGVAAVGWPPLRWLSKLRPDPLRRLGLGRGRLSGSGAGEAVLRRTSLPAGSAISRAGVDTAVRAAADVASTGLSQPWPGLLRSAARRRIEEIPDALDRAVGAADLGMQRPPRWWKWAGIVQWTLLAVAVGGLVWLGLLAALSYLQIDLEAPRLGNFAWPTVLLLGGLLGGLALRVLARPFIAVGASRRRRRAAGELSRRVGAVVEELVLVPLRSELDVLTRLAAAVRRLASIKE